MTEKNNKNLPESLFGIPIVESSASTDLPKIIQLGSFDDYRVPLDTIPIVITKNEDGIFRASIEPTYLAEHPESSELLKLVIKKMSEMREMDNTDD